MAKFHKLVKKAFLLPLFLSAPVFAAVQIIQPSLNAYEEIQEALILAEPGDIIRLTSGTYNLEDSLSLDVDNVQIEGEGMTQTILNFKNQKSGAQGLSVTSDNVTLQDFSVQDAKGDAIKVKGVTNIKFLRVKTEWTDGPKSENGAYGLYPVESKNILIDGCVAIGASDAGIYVGQSQNIIVRNSRAEFNVAGIEIENSYYADVYNNVATNNTGGILIFDLPSLPQQGGHHVRVFNNKSVGNNTDNFAPEGNIVGEVPRGTGIIIQANSDVEIFNNIIGDNDTVNIAVVTYGNDTDDEEYYPHPKSIQIHGNEFGPTGYNPDTSKGELAQILFDLSGGDMPDIFWDGLVPLSQLVFGQPGNERMIISNNGDATILALDPIKYLLPFFDPAILNIKAFEGTIQPLSPVEFDENF
ncbi:right-handed parallel beta-helix repeat-containing protein [Gammaproteobacteria bacterium]|nr:right-handed parallel beta-helix repeat-containing protein [Gammaproteobacteria bacterium]MDB4094558.1 right-handed parallel beta-helix repeat-containing protein [Gammaproteobacteria bacterium]MDB9900289.1 right-handed parallel beta-helix repeat-containing protein [Gammaproteobacteria bacterium]MDC0122780.1 right-handed parallel beta-helix repeat-containing protein [Gammaproteobacteria bacterium]MDC1277170.1 right-handed parallel beta-helix repeat-containing protein [Gammaproteobacteria bact